ncbi:MAG TPA: ferric reductase-like transmembrane domain-containing protein [Thermoleophilaceae bacterium]
MTLAAAHGPSALWYATRGTGAVTLVLLTASVVLGIVEVRAWRPAGTSLVAVASLHRTFSLLAVALLAVHVVTTLLDPFPHIGALTAVIPFAGSYRPLWVGFGAIACDLLLALVITSLLRRRLGFGAWRGVHWFAYVCWPLALVHGLGSGSDAKTSWMLLLTAACAGAVVLALLARLAGPATRPRLRTLARVGTGLAAIAFVVWLAQGPLARGWARRAGTPASVLAAFAPPGSASAPAARAAARSSLDQPFSAGLRGVIKRGHSAGGSAVVDLRMHLTRGPPGVLRIRLGGQPLADGGLLMNRSAVSFGPPSDAARYRGRVEALRDTVLQTLVGSPQGNAVRLVIRLFFNGGSVRGDVQGTPVGSSGQ